MIEPLDELPDRTGSPTWADDRARLQPVEGRLRYAFARPALLRVALTHPSWVGLHPRSGWPSNARLEFFGDAVLDLLATEALWGRFPGASEGDLTRLHAVVVSTPTLAQAARAIDLGRAMWVSHNHAMLRDHEGALADATEAVLAAAFLDARAAGRDPLVAASAVFTALLGARVADLQAGEGKPPTARLQEWAQARWRRSTVKWIRLDEGTQANRPSWRVRAEVICPDGQVVTLAEGEGTSLRAAQASAAEAALVRVERGEFGG